MEFLSVYIPLYKKTTEEPLSIPLLPLLFVKKRVVMQGHSDHSMRIFSD